ncbi:winged helix-turn-helix transcriptional regulator [Candidatus Ozemobacteraceae bacterium]|nr:winged helix-turn-helix transcriptional regulator [Candidatus Ozemobacteraceae bacterium]
MKHDACCDPRKLRRPVQILKALAHPVRLYLVMELARGEKCVCELTDQVCCDVSTVSRHLSQLKNAGIVEDDKRGLQVFYRLRAPCIIEFISCLGQVPLGHSDLTDAASAAVMNEMCGISASRRKTAGTRQRRCPAKPS